MTMDIIRKDGMRGLYRGLSASYLGVSEGVIQWVLYEVCTPAIPPLLSHIHLLRLTHADP